MRYAKPCCHSQAKSEAGSDSSYQIVGPEDLAPLIGLANAASPEQRSATASPDLAAADAILELNLSMMASSERQSRLVPGELTSLPAGMGTPSASATAERPPARLARRRRFSIGPGITSSPPVLDAACLMDRVASLEEERDFLAARLLETGECSRVQAKAVMQHSCCLAQNAYHLTA